VCVCGEQTVLCVCVCVVSRLFNRIYDKLYQGIHSRPGLKGKLARKAYKTKTENLRKNILTHPFWCVVVPCGVHPG
jgi:hypothetical protein